MRSLGTVFLCCILLFAGAQAAAAGQGRVGVVDMQVFQEKSKAFQKVRAELKKKYEAFQAKLDAEKKELRRVEEEFKKQSMMLSLDAKEDKKRELEKKQRHYKYLAEEYTREMQAAEVEAKKRIGKELSRVVEKIGKEEGYTLIFERRTVGLLYYDHALDITEKVATAYDESKNP
ncbi:MAG: OmpH family outer membrane protein [Deltaproteobacteria bacterium]|nr:OmpH family outer membrane protein [Deltaproteobacteria bacterium]RLB33842.1 MAG: hypothetical protein DRH20_12870 [Deltaproteobacteria bacterium]